MRQIAKAIAKIEDEIKTLTNLRDRLSDAHPLGQPNDAISTINAEIELLQRVLARLKEAVETKPKPSGERKASTRTRAAKPAAAKE